MHWAGSKGAKGSGRQQRRKNQKKHRRGEQDPTQQQQDQGVSDTEQQHDQGVDDHQQQRQEDCAFAHQWQQQQQQEEALASDQAAEALAGPWPRLVPAGAQQPQPQPPPWPNAPAASSSAASGRPSTPETVFYPANSGGGAMAAAAAALVSIPLTSLTSTGSTVSEDSLPFADAQGTPPTSPFAELAARGEPFGSDNGSDAAAPPPPSLPEPTARLPPLPYPVAAAAEAAAASLAFTSALQQQPSSASYASSLGRASTESDTSSSGSGAGARGGRARGGGARDPRGEDAPGGLLRVDTVPLLSLLARADSPPDSVATVPSGSGSDSGDGCGPSAAAAAAGGGAEGKPALSPARARLIARLQQRQRERELEEAASCDLAAYFGSGGGACPPPAERARDGLVLVSGGAMIPHVAKTRTGGEDAYFTTESGHGALGVADGVSSWADDGVDPGEYSRALVQNLQHLMEQAPTASAPHFEGRAVLRRAQMATMKPGSATVVLAALRPRPQSGGGAAAGGPCASSSSTAGSSSQEGIDPADWESGDADGDGSSSSGGSEGPGGAFELHISNLGDCGVKVVRDGRIVLSTQPQQHDFNLPYQMSHPRLFPETDIADSADRYVMEVREGDVIVAASDGLFDNMWDDQLLEVLAGALSGRAPPALAPPRLRRASSSFKALRSRLKRSGGSKGSLLPSSGSAPMLRRVASESCAQPALAASPPARGGGGLEAPGSLAAADVDPGSLTAAQLAQRAAESLVRVAFRNAGDERYKSPWAAAAKRQGLMARLFAHGGKMDDCTAVVAIVRDVRAVGAPEVEPLVPEAAEAALASEAPALSLA